MDWTAALTLAFAGIGALGTVCTVVDGFTKRRAERQARAEADAAAWSLHASAMDETGQWKLRIRYETARDRPIAIRELRVVAPQNAEIALFDRTITSDFGPGKDMPTAEGWRASIPMNVDLSHGYLFVGVLICASSITETMKFLSAFPRPCCPVTVRRGFASR